MQVQKAEGEARKKTLHLWAWKKTVHFCHNTHRPGPLFQPLVERMEWCSEIGPCLHDCCCPTGQTDQHPMSADTYNSTVYNPATVLLS